MYRETLMKVLTALVYNLKINTQSLITVMQKIRALLCEVQHKTLHLHCFFPISDKCSIFRCGDALQEDVEYNFMYIVNLHHYFV